MLQHQFIYLDKYPQLLIIPIMTIDEVRQWNFGGYSAILLATSTNADGENYRTPAAKVYKRIGATTAHEDHDIFLATSKELNDATILLDSFVRNLATAYQNLPQGVLKEWEKLGHKEEEYTQSMFYVPKLVTTTIQEICHGFVAVRKVTFCHSRKEVNNYHQAPDPVLLLSKAASNWLKHNNIFILPCCTTEDNNYEDDVDSIQSIPEKQASCRGDCFFCADNAACDVGTNDNLSDDDE
jgi:hypothetical protein